MRTVLWFAHECAPYHRPASTVGAQRPAKLAKYLRQFGWRAIVVCCDAAARGRRETAADTIERVRHALAAADPDASVIVPTASLPHDGWLDAAWRRLLPNGGDDSRAKVIARKSLTAAKFLTGDYSQSWQPMARVAAEEITTGRHIAACIGEHSPDAGLFLARWFSREYDTPWVADFRDPILDPIRPLARPLYERRVRQLLRSAAAVINVTPVWTDMDRQLWRRPAWCIPNGFDPDDYVEPARRPNRRFTVTYTGSLHAQHRLDIFFRGAAMLPSLIGEAACSEFVFTYRGLASARVRDLARQAGVEHLTDIGDRVDRPEAMEALGCADLLLLLSATDARDVYYARGYYPGKAFEYFGARRPILCVKGDGGQLDALLAETETGVIRQTADEVAHFLADAWREWKAGRSIQYQPNEEALSRYTRRAQAGQLAQLLDRLAASPNVERAGALSSVPSGRTMEGPQPRA